MSHPEKFIIPEGESFYSVMNRLRLFFVKFWESDEDTCTIVTYEAITNILSLMFLQAIYFFLILDNLPLIYYYLYFLKFSYFIF